MDKLYTGVDKITGELYNVIDKANENRNPFKAYLDIGLTRATIGNRVFGAMKGACDAGLNIPHTGKHIYLYIYISLSLSLSTSFTFSCC